MKIALIGYGKMGRLIEQLALGMGHEIVGRFTSAPWDMPALQQADVCIEFTEPKSVLHNIKKLIECGKSIVVGTTGWHHQIDEVQKLLNGSQSGLLYSSNFSLGMNLFYEVLNQASKLFNLFPEYDVAGIEYHHKQKKDSPSGSAVNLSCLIEQNMPSVEPLSFSSVRCGTISGIHSILFDSPFDTITFTHEAKSREGFARGAIQAAEWLQGKRGLYTFDDCIKSRRPACI